MEYNCPNCGAPLQFRSSISVYTTCTFCRSTIVRHDMDLEKIGEQAELLNDMSPFQVGTRGQYQGNWFTLLGRIKLVYDGGTWSEWYGMMDDGRDAWLAEAQGFYMMSFPLKLDHFPDPKMLKVNAKVGIEGTWYTVDDLRKVRYAASEGELPFVFQKDFKAFSVDLRAPGGKFASMLFGPEGPEAYVGHYVPFEEFKFEQLRAIDGW